MIQILQLKRLLRIRYLWFSSLFAYDFAFIFMNSVYIIIKSILFSPIKTIMIETIKLNIGGHHHEIHSALLEVCPNSVLALTVSEQCKDNDETEVFIDRDGTIFRYVLNYLRDGHVTIPITETIEALMKELDWYGIEAHFEDIHVVPSSAGTTKAGTRVAPSKTSSTMIGTTPTATNVPSCTCNGTCSIHFECGCIRVHPYGCRCDCGGRTHCHGRSYHVMHGTHGAHTACKYKCEGLCGENCGCQRSQRGCTSECHCACCA